MSYCHRGSTSYLSRVVCSNVLIACFSYFEWPVKAQFYAKESKSDLLPSWFPNLSSAIVVVVVARVAACFAGSDRWSLSKILIFCPWRSCVFWLLEFKRVIFVETILYVNQLILVYIIGLFWRNPQEWVVVYKTLNFHNLVIQYQFFVHIECHCFERLDFSVVETAIGTTLVLAS